MSDEDRQDEPDEPRVDGGGQRQSANKVSGDLSVEQVTGSPLSSASAKADTWPQLFGESLTRKLLPQLEVFREQQRMAESLIRDVGGLGLLQQQVAAAQPLAEAFRAQRLLAEGVVKDLSVASDPALPSVRPATSLPFLVIQEMRMTARQPGT